jgi:transcriptional regulator with XRE-family HTH domain
MSKKKKQTIFGKNLIRLRKERGLTQAELAKRAKLTQRMIVYYENEAGNPPIDKIKNIADALNVDIKTLLLEDNINNKTISDEFINLNMKTLKRIKQILSLTPEQRHMVYAFVDSLINKNKKKAS